MTVNEVQSNKVILAAPLTASHATGELLIHASPNSECRSLPFSSNGSQLNYNDCVGIHEAIHSLGFVPTNAPHFIAGGHVSTAGPSGTFDVMWSGSEPSGCFAGTPHATPAQSGCVLDPTHQEYFQVSTSSGILDLSRSLFLEPEPSNGLPPPGW